MIDSIGSITKKIVPFAFCAVGFMAFSHTYAASLDCATASNINVPVIECQALLEFYDSTNGSWWTDNTNRDTDTDVCTWYGILCEEVLWQDRVTSISMASNWLNGILPASLSNLAHIKNFQVSSNLWLTWSLQSSRSAWTNIENFIIPNTNIGGSLPSERSARENIEYFIVPSTNISGELPASWSSWTSIYEFNASSTNISGELPGSWSSWTSIYEFRIMGTNIGGSLPSERSSWENIFFFSLSDNNISGELPASWSSWTSIYSFGLLNNNIGGSLPSERSAWTGIHSIDLSNNNIGGSLPSERSAWTNIQSIYLPNNNIGGSLPASWSSWTSVQSIELSSNDISWFLPASRYAFSTIQNFNLSDNRIYGYVPQDWMDFLSPEYKFVLTNNCLRDHNYSQDQQDWIDTYTIYNPQGNCADTDISITKSTTQGLVDTGSVIDYEILYHNSGFEAFGVVIHEVPWAWLTILDASEIYTVTSNEEYWVAWDVCYDDLYNNNTGTYLALIDQWVYDNFRFFWTETLQQYIQDNYGYFWSDRWAYWIDEWVFMESTSSFQNFMYTNSLDMTSDPDCGYVDGPVVYTYVFSIGDVVHNFSGVITITGYITDSLLFNQTTIQNTVTIEIQNPETDYTNNTDSTLNYFSFAPPILWCMDEDATNYDSDAQEDDGSCTYPSWGDDEDPEEDISSWGGGWWVTVVLDTDTCPDGDHSGSYYDGQCEKQIRHLAPFYQCPYSDGYFQIYKNTFFDIQWTRYQDAVNILLDKCIVHGIANKWTEFGIYRNLTLGELYKIIVRYHELSLYTSSWHWAHSYYQRGQEHWFRLWISDSLSFDRAVTYNEVITVINTITNKNIPLRHNGSALIKRSSFALIMAALIVNNPQSHNNKTTVVTLATQEKEDPRTWTDKQSQEERKLEETTLLR